MGGEYDFSAYILSFSTGSLFYIIVTAFPKLSLPNKTRMIWNLQQKKGKVQEREALNFFQINMTLC